MLTRAPQTDNELYHLVQALWGVTIPRTQVCPEHQSPFDAFADAFFGRSPVSVWKGSRGFGGKSRTLAYLVLTEAVVLGAEVNLLGGSGAQSVNIHEAMREGWDSPLAPHHMILRETNVGTVLTNGARVRALMASQRSVRGPHPQRLRLDEIDEMELAILDSAMGQPMPKKGIDTQTVMSSTHQYPDKTMSAILERADENGWPVFSWCYKETSNPIDGWLSPATIARKREEVSAHMFAVEYDLQEPAIGNRAFITEAVQDMFSLGQEWLEVPKKTESEQYTFEEPTRHGEYVTAADWAKERDRTVIVTMRTDCYPWRVVAYSRTFRKPYPFMIKLMNERVAKYGGRAIHDATGLGNVVSDYLDARVKGFIMSGRARDDMLTEYIAAVEKGDIVSPKIKSAYVEHLYASNEDMYGGGKDAHLPDTVCAFALAWHMRKNIKPNVRPMIDITNDGSYWKAM